MSGPHARESTGGERGDDSSLHGLLTRLRAGRIDRRTFLTGALGLGLSLPTAGTLLAACGGGSSATATRMPAPLPSITPDKPQKLYIYNWRNELAPENRRRFYEQTGIQIVESYYDDNEALLANLEAGAMGYDIIVPSDYMVSVMIRERLLLPIDTRLLPGLAQLEPKFQKPAYDPSANGRRYSVPWVWGTTGIAVRSDLYSRPVDSWAVLWDPSNDGRIDMLNDERESIGAALKLLGHSINTTDGAQIDDATQKLIQQKPLVREYDSVNMRTRIVDGVPLVHTWNGDAYQAQKKLGADRVRYVLPKEGFAVWTDNLCIPVGVRSVYGAHLFMQFMLEGRNAADLVEYVEYYPTTSAASEFLSPAVYARIPSDEEMKRGEVMTDVGDVAKTYAAAWTEVRGA